MFYFMPSSAEWPRPFPQTVRYIRCKKITIFATQNLQQYDTPLFTTRHACRPDIGKQVQRPSFRTKLKDAAG